LTVVAPVKLLLPASPRIVVPALVRAPDVPEMTPENSLSLPGVVVSVLPPRSSVPVPEIAATASAAPRLRAAPLLMTTFDPSGITPDVVVSSVPPATSVRPV
jgi:hypothetical protein